jgi:hypothetical protein
MWSNLSPEFLPLPFVRFQYGSDRRMVGTGFLTYRFLQKNLQAFADFCIFQCIFWIFELVCNKLQNLLGGKQAAASMLLVK